MSVLTPLNRDRGETLVGYEGVPFTVIAPREIVNRNNLLTSYEDRSGFRPKRRVRPIMDDAVAFANGAFLAAGAILPINIQEDDVTVQAYPMLGKIAIVVQKRIANDVHFFTRFYDLPEAVMADLMATAKKGRA